jgi:hypothetical protein
MVKDMQWRKSWWGMGGGRPPPTFTENDEFSEILLFLFYFKNSV